MEQVAEKYNINADDVIVEVRILKDPGRNPKYELVKQKISNPTLALLDEVKNKLIEKINLSSEEILDPKVALKLKDRFTIESCAINESIKYIEMTDNELYNLSLKKKLPLVTDETKIVHHTRNRIEVYFTTIFLIMLVEVKYFTKEKALSKLEELRNIRNWRNNIIYLITKNQLEKL